MTMLNRDVDDINKVLLKEGKNIYGEPLYRVVFSDDCVENRRGTFNDFSPQGIFIRTVTEVREVKKYPWIKGKWLLEKWATGEQAKHQDLVTLKSGVYVCVYAFQDKEGAYLPPLLKVCEILIKHLKTPRSFNEALNGDFEKEVKEEKLELEGIEEKLKIASDESATKDMKSQRESASVGYISDKIKEKVNE